MFDTARGGAADRAPAEEVAHLALLVGRLLLLNGCDTAEVQAAMGRFAEAFGREANVLVTYEGLLVTLELEGQFRTKVGHRVPAMNVGLGAVGAVNRVLAAVAGGSHDLAWARAELRGGDGARIVRLPRGGGKPADRGRRRGGLAGARGRDSLARPVLRADDGSDRGGHRRTAAATAGPASVGLRYG
jgi:hypothetical protein